MPRHITRRYFGWQAYSPLALVTTLLFGLLSTSALATSALADKPVVAINSLIDGLHKDAAAARFENYFERYTDDAVFLGTDKTERWTIDQFKAYARPVFDTGRGWSYTVIERHVEGDSDLRWFDEILFNEKLGHCRGTGVVKKTQTGWRVAHYSLTLLIPNSVAATIGEQSKIADAK